MICSFLSYNFYYDYMGSWNPYNLPRKDEGEVQVNRQSANMKPSIDTPTDLYGTDRSVLIRYVGTSDPYSSRWKVIVSSPQKLFLFSHSMLAALFVSSRRASYNIHHFQSVILGHFFSSSHPWPPTVPFYQQLHHSRRNLHHYQWGVSRTNNLSTVLILTSTWLLV
jgi:hypothetical protein